MGLIECTYECETYWFKTLKQRTWFSKSDKNQEKFYGLSLFLE